MLFAIAPLTCPVVEITPELLDGLSYVAETVVGDCQIFKGFAAGFLAPTTVM